MKYLIILETTNTGFSAYSPDIQGCIATGATEEEAKTNIIEAIAFHLEGLNEAGEKIPVTQSKAIYVEIAA